MSWVYNQPARTMTMFLRFDILKAEWKTSFHVCFALNKCLDQFVQPKLIPNCKDSLIELWHIEKNHVEKKFAFCKRFTYIQVYCT